jgi:hypothetical protein
LKDFFLLRRAKTWIFNPLNIFYYLAIIILMLPTVGAKSLSGYFKNLKLDNEKK